MGQHEQFLKHKGKYLTDSLFGVCKLIELLSVHHKIYASMFVTVSLHHIDDKGVRCYSASETYRNCALVAPVS